MTKCRLSVVIPTRNNLDCLPKAIESVRDQRFKEMEIIVADDGSVDGTDAYLTDFPGLTKDSATWLGHKGITMFGVEAVSPGRPGRNNFEVHHVCRDKGFTHMEGLMNLDQLVGQGRFRFIGFPLKIKGGTGSPIRAVAWLD